MLNRKTTILTGLTAILAGIFIGSTLATAQEPATAPAYVGLTTKNTYQPMPTTTQAADKSIVTTTYPAIHVVPIDDALRTSYRINPFYKKTLSIGGVVVVGSEKVSDYAFLEAAYTLDHQFKESPKWLHDALATNKVYLAIMADVEYTSDLPGGGRGPLAQQATSDRRSRGLGGQRDCSCGEENLLNLEGDHYFAENITIHEFSHTTANIIGTAQGGRQSGPWWTKLKLAFSTAMAPGGRLEVYNKTHPGDPFMAKNGGKVYASNNEQEYWAEGAQAWFDNANPGNSGGIATRDDVKQKDPLLAACLLEIYGDGTWRYTKTTSPSRPKEDLTHLAGMDRTKFPIFDYNNSPRIKAYNASTQAATATAPKP